METKLMNLKGSIILLAFIFACSSVYATDLEEIEVNFLPSEDSEQNSADISSVDPLAGVDISYNKTFHYQNNIATETRRKDFQQTQNTTQNIEKTLFLGPNEFVEMTGIDKRRKLFNGAIIVEFEQVPDPNWFASQNNVRFISDLSDIKRGVFKIDNLYDVEGIIRSLESNSNVRSVEFDTVDPAIEIN
jgi:hypothetical protein